MYNTIRYKMAHPYHKMAENFKNCTERLDAIDAVFNAANVRETKSADDYYGIYTQYAPKDKSCYDTIDVRSFVDNMKAAATFKSEFFVQETAQLLLKDLYLSHGKEEKKKVIQTIIETIEKQYNENLKGGSSKKRASTHRRLKSRATSAARRRNRRRRTARK